MKYTACFHSQRTRSQLYPQQQQSTGGLTLNVTIGPPTKYILITQILQYVFDFSDHRMIWLPMKRKTREKLHM